MAKEGFLRVLKCEAVIKDILASIMRDYMEQHKPRPTSELYDIMLKNKKFSDKLSPEAHNQLQNLAVDGFSQLDITLMYKIARFFKTFYNPPTRDWNAYPSPLEIEIGDDMARIRTARNHYAHCAEITQHKMENFFSEFAAVGKRFDQRLNKTGNNSYEYCILGYKNIEIGNFEKNAFEVEVKPGHFLCVFTETIYYGTNRKSDSDQVECKLHICGIGNEREVADAINERKEKINDKSTLIKLDKATVGSLVIHIFIDSKLVSDHQQLFKGLERIIQLLFTDLKYTKSTDLYAVIRFENDDEDTEDYEDSSDEDDEDRSLILDFTAPAYIFERKDTMIQHFGNFMTAVSTNMNGQKVNLDRNIKAVLETKKEDDEDNNAYDDSSHKGEEDITREDVRIVNDTMSKGFHMNDNEDNNDYEIPPTKVKKTGDLLRAEILQYDKAFT